MTWVISPRSQALEWNDRWMSRLHAAQYAVSSTASDAGISSSGGRRTSSVSAAVTQGAKQTLPRGRASHTDTGRAIAAAHLHLAGVDLLAAMLAGEDHPGRVAALVLQQHRRACFCHRPLVAPAEATHQHGVQVAPLLCQAVLVPRGAFLVEPPLENAGVHEPLEACGQHISRDPKPLLEAIEAAHAVE